MCSVPTYVRHTHSTTEKKTCKIEENLDDWTRGDFQTICLIGVRSVPPYESMTLPTDRLTDCWPNFCQSKAKKQATNGCHAYKESVFFIYLSWIFIEELKVDRQENDTSEPSRTDLFCRNYVLRSTSRYYPEDKMVGMSLKCLRLFCWLHLRSRIFKALFLSWSILRLSSGQAKTASQWSSFFKTQLSSLEWVCLNQRTFVRSIGQLPNSSSSSSLPLFAMHCYKAVVAPSKSSRCLPQTQRSLNCSSLPKIGWSQLDCSISVLDRSVGRSVGRSDGPRLHLKKRVERKKF